MPSNSSKKSFVILFILIILGLSAMLYWLKAIHPYETTDNAYLKAHVSLISPKESGYVTAVLFEDNQAVKAGDLLVTIDDRDFLAEVAKMQAQLTMEQARIQTLEAHKRTQTAKIQQETANIQAAEAELRRADQDLQRFNNLAEEGAVSAQTRDTAAAVHSQSRAQLTKMQSSKQEAQDQLTTWDMEIQETRARIQAAEAHLSLARIQLANTHIIAPMAGMIGNRSVQLGQLVKPGSVLAYLIPTQDVFVEANFKETQIAAMRPGQTVEIHIDAYPDQHFEGVIDSFAPASGSEFSLLPPENATGNFTKIVRRIPVKIRFNAGTDLSPLKPGLSTVVKVKVR